MSRPLPRLHAGLVRLGMSAASAAHILSHARQGLHAEKLLARHAIRAAFFLRHTSLPRHPDASRPERRKGFGRFPYPGLCQRYKARIAELERPGASALSALERLADEKDMRILTVKNDNDALRACIAQLEAQLWND